MKLFQKLINLLSKLKLMLINFHFNGKEIDLTAEKATITSTNFKVDENGKVLIIDTIAGSSTVEKVSNLTIQNKENTIKTEIIPNRVLAKGSDAKAYLWVTKDWAYVGATSDNETEKCRMVSAGSDLTFIDCSDGINTSTITPTTITTETLIQTSIESKKKNIEKMGDDALNIIKNIDIYRYNFKSEKDTDKKHLGFVIGDNYNYSEEITNNDNEGVDNYSFTSLCCKAIQEQQKIIEDLQEKIKELEVKYEKDNV